MYTENELRALLNDVLKNCTKCIYWDFNNDMCGKFDVKPPATVIVKGCEHFMPDDIPF